jgi:hypothetical protein
LLDNDAFINRNNDLEPPRQDEVSSYSHFTLRASDLRHHQAMRGCLVEYFRTWHPLLPFLDGAYLISAFDNAVALAQLDEALQARDAGFEDRRQGGTGDVSSGSGEATRSKERDGAAFRKDRPAFEGLKEAESLILSAIIKAVVSIGAKGMSSLSAEEKAGLPLLLSTTQVTMLGHFIVGASENSSVSDLFAIQALLGIELYLYVTRSMRPAMHLSGVIVSTYNELLRVG